MRIVIRILLWPLWGTNYDQVARLWQDGLVEERMAYGEFSYEAEKIWCNEDIQKFILDSKKRDGHLRGYQSLLHRF